MISIDKKIKEIFYPSFIVIAVFAVFYPSLNGGFLNWDDWSTIINNKYIRDLSFTGVLRILANPSIKISMPFDHLISALEYHFFKINPFGYHLVNLIVHSFNAILVFLLFYTLTGNKLKASAVGILFAVHPLQAEFVAWITSRNVLISGFFYLSAAIFYLKYLKINKVRYFLLALAGFSLSLLSKPQAVSFLLFIFLLDFFPGVIKHKNNGFIYKSPFLAITILYVAGIVFTSRGSIPVFNFTRLPGYFLTFSFENVFYLYKLIWPLNLSCLYPYNSFNDIVYPGVYLFIYAMILLPVIYSLKFTRKIFFAYAFFLILAAPSLQINALKSSLVADRYVYLAGIGIFYLFAEFLFWLYGLIIKKAGGIRVVFMSLMIIIFALFSVLTWQRCGVWTDSLLLWSDVIKKYPDTFPIAYNQLAVAYTVSGQSERAIPILKKTIALWPQFDNAYANLGKAYIDTGQFQNAVNVLNKALTFSQSEHLGLVNRLLGNAQNSLGNIEQAVNCYLKAVKIDPLDFISYNNLAQIYVSRGEAVRAVALYRKALRIDPYSAGAYQHLAEVYTGLKENSLAENVLKQALAIAPENVNTYILLEKLYRNRNDQEALISLFESAVLHKTGYLTAYLTLAERHIQKNEDDKAIALYEKALKINPSSGDVLVNLGKEYCVTGKIKSAIKVLNKALKSDRNSGVAHNNLAVAYYYDKQYDLAVMHRDKAVESGYKVQPELNEWLKNYRDRK